MRAPLFFLILLSFVALAKKPPEKIVFPTKAGEVVFIHAAHIRREKRNCTVCHDKLWTKSTAKPLKSSDGCKTCHHTGGAAFETKGNCAKCHGAGAEKTSAQLQ